MPDMDLHFTRGSFDSEPQRLPLLSSLEALTRQASDQLWPGQVQTTSEMERFRALGLGRELG